MDLARKRLGDELKLLQEIEISLEKLDTVQHMLKVIKKANKAKGGIATARLPGFVEMAELLRG